MFLGYYSHRIKEFFRNSYRNFSFRQKGNIIRTGCKISLDLKSNGKFTLRDNVRIGQNVVLCNGVLIGSNSKIENIEIGENSHIEGGVIITGCGNGRIKIGKESYIGVNNILDFSANITIGSFVHIAGPSTGLWTHSSALMCLNNIPLDQKSEKFRPTAPIIIEDNVYIGGNCTLYPGVTIGHHSIITPNSAVTKNVEPFTMVGGVPTKFIKALPNIEKHQEDAV